MGDNDERDEGQKPPFGAPPSFQPPKPPDIRPPDIRPPDRPQFEPPPSAPPPAPRYGGATDQNQPPTTSTASTPALTPASHHVT